MTLLPLALSTALTAMTAFQPCLHPGERQTQVQPVPAAYGLQLVGVAWDRRMQPVVLIRFGSARNAASNTYSEGERIWARLEILDVGAHSVLLRENGSLYVLKMASRSARDWNLTVATLPECTSQPVAASGSR